MQRFSSRPLVMRLRKKEHLARWVMQDWVTKILAWRQKKHLSLLAYHSIQPKLDHYPFNIEIISAYPDIFEQQMAFIARHFNVITFQDLLSYIDYKPQSKPGLSLDLAVLAARLPANSLIITFDDGYADNLTIASPIMQAFDIRAVFFLATDYIDQQQLFWFDEVAYIIRTLPNGPLSLMDGHWSVMLNQSNRELQRRACGCFLKTLSEASRREAIQELRVIANFNLGQESFELAAPLTWDQARALRAMGMEIGAHTRSHGFLDMMTSHELTDQILGSKRLIEQQLGETIISFSYPNGNFSPAVIECVQAAGFHFAVSYEHGIARLGQVNPYLVPRIHVETDVSMRLFKGNVMFPELFVDSYSR